MRYNSYKWTDLNSTGRSVFIIHETHTSINIQSISITPENSLVSHSRQSISKQPLIRFYDPWLILPFLELMYMCQDTVYIWNTAGKKIKLFLGNIFLLVELVIYILRELLPKSINTYIIFHFSYFNYPVDLGTWKAGCNKYQQFI